MDLFQNETINITVSKEDAVIILKSLKTTSSRKLQEAKQSQNKGHLEWYNTKIEYVKKLEQLSHYLHYLTK